MPTWFTHTELDLIITDIKDYFFPRVLSFGEFLNLKMVLMSSNVINGFPEI